jgi:hypothetical protein
MGSEIRDELFRVRVIDRNLKVHAEFTVKRVSLEKVPLRLDFGPMFFFG